MFSEWDRMSGWGGVDGECNVAEPHPFYTDPDAFKGPDPVFHFDADSVGWVLT
jgi:hypothetical protein